MKREFTRLLRTVTAILVLLFVQVTVYGQLTVYTSGFLNNNASDVITFNFQNTNSDPVQITGAEGITSSSSPTNPASLYWNPAPVYPIPTGGISVANGWNLVGTGTYAAIPNSTTTTTQVMLSGLNLVVPANSTIGLAFTTTGMRYSTITAGPFTFSNSGCNIITGANIGYGGTLTSLPNTPRGFLGGITFVPLGACSGTPSAGTIQGPALVCNGTGTTLNLTGATLAAGITYQWKASTTPGGPYTNVGTGFSYATGPLTSTTYYVCEATCSNSGLSSTTAEFTVPVVGSPPGGTFTIDNTLPTGGTNYNSFTAAINWLNSAGQCGTFTSPVTFDVISGQTFSENPPAIQVTGSLANPITFQKSGAGSNPVITPSGGNGATATTDFGLAVYGGDFFTFDGIDINSSANANVEYGYLIRNQNATNGCDNVEVRNCTITLNRTNLASLALLSTASTTGGGFTPTAATGANSNGRFHDIAVRNCALGGMFVISGTATWPGTGNWIYNNEIGQAFAGTPLPDIGSAISFVSLYGINSSNQSNLKVYNNTVQNMGSTTGTNRGIWVQGGLGTIEVYNNRVNGIRAFNSTTAIQRGMEVNLSTTGSNVAYIYNNFVSGLSSNYTGTATATRGLSGIFLGSANASQTYHVDYNNVSIDGTASPNLSNCALEFGGNTATHNVRNNVLANFTGAQTGVAIHLVVRTTVVGTIANAASILNFNDYYIANATNGFVAQSATTNYATTALWDAAVTTPASNDVNSLSVDPGFIDNAGNPYANNSALDGTADMTGISWVTTDIFGTTRTAPHDRGANLIGACTLTTPPGNTLSTAASICPATPFTLFLQNGTLGSGVIYQWQSSPDNTTYTNIPGAVAATLGTTLTASTWYRCQVTCTGFTTETSNPVQVLVSPFQNCYCTSIPTFAADEEIFSVTLNGSTNAYACAAVAPGPGSILNQYSNFTTLPPLTSLQQGQSAAYTVEENECDGATFYSFGTGIWVDWNQNGSFNDPGETVLQEATTLIGPRNITGSLTVPVNAVPGNTRMRIIVAENIAGAALVPCLSYSYGETEDYLITIVASPPCVDPPTPGTLTASATAVCVGTTVNFNVTGTSLGSGQIYQWESSPDGNTWSPIVGANTLTYSAVINTAAYYKLAVTCGTTAYTNSVQVTLNNFLSCYCASNATSNLNTDILNVTLAGLNNSSICNELAPGPGSIPSQYSNYSTSVTPPVVSQNQVLPFSVQVGTCGTNINNWTKIWIDYNQNGLFTDAGEEVYSSATFTLGAHFETGNITIPLAATTGQTMIRVVTVQTTVATGVTPCGTYAAGETEDYRINIVAAVPCVDPPTPGTITASATNTCAGGTVTLSLTGNSSGTGQTFQWQSSPDNVNWTNVPGATTPLLSVPVNSATWYQVQLICSGGTPVFTPSVQITVSPFYLCYCSTSLHTSASPCISNVTLGSINNTTGGGCSLPSYTLYFPPAANQTTNLEQTTTYTLTATHTGSVYCWLYFDWNQDGDMDDVGENYLPSTGNASLTATHTFTIPVPNTATLGMTGMRIRTRTVNTPGACTQNYGSGETENYVVTVVPPPACPAPSPSMGLVLASSAVVNWTCPSCTGSYFVEYGPTGYTPGTGNTLGGGTALLGPFPNGTNTVTLTGLLGFTPYSVYMRQDCSNSSNGYSNNGGPATFTTQPGCGSNFYDSGGASAPYSNNENNVSTICPNNPGDIVVVQFSSFSTEANWDPLYVYNGNSTAAPKIASTNGAPSGNNVYGTGGWWGTTAPTNTGVPGLVAANNGTGCLTFAFTSDASGTPAGWAATISCVTPNLSCANAAPILCGETKGGFTLGGTFNLPASACGFNGAPSSGGVAWYTYTALADNDVVVSTCGQASFDTRISVFAPVPDCSNLSCIGGVDNIAGCPGGSTEMTFKAITGQTYYIAVHGAGTAEGTFSVSLFCVPVCTPGNANDLCANASSLSASLIGTGVPSTGENGCAYVDGPTACSSNLPAQGVWYTFNSGLNTQHTLTLLTSTENPAYSATAISYALYNGACTSSGAGGEITCYSGAGTTVLALAPNTDYKLLVYNQGGVGVEGTFGVKLERPAIYDASVTQVLEPVGLLCDTKFDPVVRLKNLGEAPLTDVQIDVQIDGGAPVLTYLWNGFLAFGDSVDVILPEVSTPTGVHTLAVTSTQPNGQADENNANNAASSVYNASGQTLKVRITTDNNGGETTWAIFDANFGLEASGGPYTNNITVVESVCLSTAFGNQWSFYLFDSFGDGICCASGNGSWALLDRQDKLVLRDQGTFTTQSPSAAPQTPAYAIGHEVTLPLGPAVPSNGECGVLDNLLQNKVFVNPVAGVTNYQYEFSNPDGGFRRRVLLARNYVLITDMQSNPLSLGVTYFLRTRADQNAPGVSDDNWGPGCEVGWSASAAFCTQLINTPGPTFSCGVTRTFGGSDKIWAQPVPGVIAVPAPGQPTPYQFRFTGTGSNSGYVRNIFRSSYICPLSWVTNPLVNGQTYNVQVQVWVAGAWKGFCGNTCQVTINNNPAQGGRSIAKETASDNVQLWPNPVRDGHVNLRIDGLADAQQNITVDVFDVFGKRVLAKTYDNSGELFNTVLELNGDIASGLYMVNITVNDRIYTKRVSVL